MNLNQGMPLVAPRIRPVLDPEFRPAALAVQAFRAAVNGSEGSAVYRLHEPNTILLGKTGQDLAPVPVPAEFLKPADSPRDPSQGEPATIFRYDLVWEFISAIVEKRQAVPSFLDGLNAQIVADSVLESYDRRTWIDIARAEP